MGMQSAFIIRQRRVLFQKGMKWIRFFNSCLQGRSGEQVNHFENVTLDGSDAKHQEHHFDLFCQSRCRGEKRLETANFLLLKTQDFYPNARLRRFNIAQF